MAPTRWHVAAAAVVLLAALAARVRADLPLPATEIALLTPQGQKMLLDASPRSDYFSLAQHFTTQINSAFCGPASSTMVLNALGTPRPAPNQAAGFVNPAYGYWDQDNVFTPHTELVVPKAQVLREGMSIDELSGFLGAHPGVASSYTRTQPGVVTLDAFRESIITALSLPRAFVVVNFDRNVIMEYGGGHHSPVAAYHSASDSVLVLDVSRYKYNAWWVGVPRLYQSCSETLDSSTNLTRGLVFAWAREQYPGAASLPADTPSNQDNGAPYIVATTVTVASAAVPAPTLHQGMGPGAVTCLALGMMAAGALVATLATTWWHRGRHQRSLRSLSSIMNEGLGGFGLGATTSSGGSFAAKGEQPGGGPFLAGPPGLGGATRRHVDDDEDRVRLMDHKEPPV